MNNLSDVKNILTIEENTDEAERAIELMDLSGLPYQVVRISKEQADEYRKSHNKVPRIQVVSKIHGVIDSLDGIEWYSKFCRGDTSYR